MVPRPSWTMPGTPRAAILAQRVLSHCLRTCLGRYHRMVSSSTVTYLPIVHLDSYDFVHEGTWSTRQLSCFGSRTVREMRPRLSIISRIPTYLRYHFHISWPIVVEFAVSLLFQRFSFGPIGIPAGQGWAGALVACFTLFADCIFCLRLKV